MLKRMQERLERMSVDRRVSTLRWATGLVAGGALVALLIALALSPNYAQHGPDGDDGALASGTMQSQLDQVRQELDQAQQRVNRLEQQIAEEAAINEALRGDLQQATSRLRQKTGK